jgi:hypothetical protein
MNNPRELDGDSQNPEDLRELARRIQEEKDTNKMIELVQQLIAMFDEQQVRKSLQEPSQEGPSRVPGNHAE